MSRFLLDVIGNLLMASQMYKQVVEIDLPNDIPHSVAQRPPLLICERCAPGKVSAS